MKDRARYMAQNSFSYSVIQDNSFRASFITPSPGTPGKGWGEGDFKDQWCPTFEIPLTASLSRSTGRGGRSLEVLQPTLNHRDNRIAHRGLRMAADDAVASRHQRAARSRMRAAIEQLENRRLLSFYYSTQLPSEVDATVYDHNSGDQLSLSNIAATGINDNGQVVGYGTSTDYSTGSAVNTMTAFVFSPSALLANSNAPSDTALSGLSGDGQASAIDSQGLVVGQSESEGFEYPSAAMFPDALPANAGTSSGFYAAGAMTNGGDEFAGGFEQVANGSSHPVLEDFTTKTYPNTFIDLTPSADASSSSFAGAVQGIGPRAVGWITGASGGTHHAAVQAADNSTGALQDISSHFSGSGDSEALAIDGSDTVVGYATFSDTGNRPQPFIYNANSGAVTRIPILSGFNQGAALAIAQVNGHESVVGWESDGTKKAAFVYDASTGVIENLNALTDADDSDLPMTLTEATGINASGTIVADGTDSTFTSAYELAPTAKFISASSFSVLSPQGSPTGDGATLEDMTPAGNGQILATGYIGGVQDPNNGYTVGSFVMYRFNSDGTKDTSFGDDGRIDGGFKGAGYGATIDSHGDILVTGTKIETDQSGYAGNTSDWVVAEYGSNGMAVSGFGTNGIVNLADVAGLRGDATQTFTGNDGQAVTEAANTPYGIAVDANNDIVVSGTYKNSSDANPDAQFAVVRLLSNGSLDTANFNPTGSTPGLVKTSFPQSMYPASGSDPGGGDDHGGRVLIQSDGKILVAGESGGRVALVRYLSNGSLDQSFDPNYGHGRARITEALSVDWNVGLAEQADGKILIAAQTSDHHFAVVRLNGDDSLDDGGSFDTTPGDHFGSGGGMATVSFGGQDDADLLIAQPGGQIDVLGTTYNGSTVSAAIAVLSSSGAVQSQQTYGDPGVSAGIIHPDLGAAGAALFEAFGAPDSHGGIVTGLGIGGNTTTVGKTVVTPSINLDAARPTATLDSVTSIPNGVAVQVTYADDVQINTSSFDSNDISASGQKTLTVGAPQVVDSFTGRPTVVYDLTDPAGWGGGDDGNYTITVNSNQVSNVGGVPASMQTLGTFSLHSISGNVFNDANGDGVKQGGEAGVAGITVFADLNSTGSASGQPSVVTDGSGNYSLFGLVSGANYTIRQDLPAGVIQTTPAGGNGNVVALANADIANADFGREATTGLSIAGTVFSDFNSNGTQDPGEAGASGIVVYADVNNSGNPSGQPQFTTDSSGHYNISGLSLNTTYTVRLVLPSGFTQTSPAANAGLQVSLLTASIGSKNFGVKGAGSSGLSGKVFNGLSGAPLAGVTVFIDANGNGTLDSGEISAITDTQGGYVFTNLAPGTYAVAEVLPSGQTASASSVNVTLGSGSSAGPTFADVPAGVVAGSVAPNLTGKFVTSPPASVISGSKAKLMLQISNTGTASATGPITVTLFASDTQTIAGATKIIDVPVRLKLKPHGVMRVPLNFTYPSGLPSGKYSIIASIDSGNATAELSKTDNLAASNPVTIAPAFVSLTSTLFVPAFVASSEKISISTVVHNGGNIPAAGPLGVAVAVSTSPDGSNATPVTSFTPRINIKAGKSQKLRFNLRMPSNLSAGSLYFVVTLDSAHKFGANAVVLLSSAVTVVT